MPGLSRQFVLALAGVADRNLGLGLAAPAGPPTVAGAFAGGGLPGSTAVSPGRRPGVCCLSCAGRGRCACRAGYLAGCARPRRPGARGWGKRMSGPVWRGRPGRSSSPQPGIDSAWTSCSSYGASGRSMVCDSSPIRVFSWSMRSSMAVSKAACSSVKNSAPSRACSSSVILRGRGRGPTGPVPSGRAAPRSGGP